MQEGGGEGGVAAAAATSIPSRLFYSDGLGTGMGTGTGLGTGPGSDTAYGSMKWRSFSLQAEALEYLGQLRGSRDAEGSSSAASAAGGGGAVDYKLFSFEAPHTGTRRFLVAAWDTFVAQYVLEMEPERRHVYEIIEEGRPCRLYFDLEYDLRDGANAQVDGEAWLLHLLRLVAWQLFELFDLVVQPSDFAVLDSSNATKFSKHVVLVGERDRPLLFPDNAHVGRFVAELVLRHCLQFRHARCVDATSPAVFWVRKQSSPEPDISSGSDKPPPDHELGFFIDTGVYSRNRAFRLFRSRKYGKTRELTLQCADTPYWRPGATRRDQSVHPGRERQSHAAGGGGEKDRAALMRETLEASIAQPPPAAYLDRNVRFLSMDVKREPQPQPQPQPQAQLPSQAQPEPEQPQPKFPSSATAVATAAEPKSRAELRHWPGLHVNRLRTVLARPQTLLLHMRQIGSPLEHISWDSACNRSQMMDICGELWGGRSVMPVSTALQNAVFAVGTSENGTTAGTAASHQDSTGDASGLVTANGDSTILASGRGASSPFPALERYMLQRLLRQGSFIRTWSVVGCTHPTATEAPSTPACTSPTSVTFHIGGSRFCHRVGREHKSNHVMLVADLVQRVVYQKCLDPDCRAVDYRSPNHALPPESELPLHIS